MTAYIGLEGTETRGNETNGKITNMALRRLYPFVISYANNCMIQLNRQVRTGRDKEDTEIGVCKTFRGVQRASALALSLMDLSLGPAISSYMTLALPIRKQHSYNASALLCPAISHI